jgi:hypothetical protein
MKNNYFYDLPEDLQERIYYINTKKSKIILNNELYSLFREYSCIKYINQSINDVETELYNFMDYNNITSYENELAIEYNIRLLKDEIIEEFNFNLLIKKKLFLLLFEYNLDNEFCQQLVDRNIINTLEETIGFWTMNMEEHLLQNHL